MPADITTLRVAVNGEACETAAVTLAELVAERGLARARVATAVNGDFVPAGRRASVSIAAGDRIEIVSPRQGG
jgi:sulfur carrier protein